MARWRFALSRESALSATEGVPQSDSHKLQIMTLNRRKWPCGPPSVSDYADTSPETGEEKSYERNFRLFTTLSMVLRGPWTPSPTRSSASAGAAAKAARLSASLVVLNIGSM